ncbi:ClpP/crotonase-like domain-containing protein [Melampsora americana]|nr:ClpP/crotonase-like domain-containing protein [Melampsora americana]
MCQSSIPPMKILFLCTAHNSLSQRLSLVLQEKGHHVTVELAISPEVMIQASELAAPDLIICPFLTKKVPAEIYDRYLTLIVHPGPPGDAGPSAIDWVLLGDDGVEPDAVKALAQISENAYVESGRGRSHWGVTVLQAIEEFDAGPVWAWDQFPISLDGPGALTKAGLYRGPVTQAAVGACLKAIERILSVAGSPSSISCKLSAEPSWATCCVSLGQIFLGGRTRTRPLLKPTERAWTPAIHNAAYVSRRLRASDSQPGVQMKLFGERSLYLYGGTIEESRSLPAGPSGAIVAQRASAVLVRTADNRGVWITHLRRLKSKTETLLPAKLPAMLCLRSIPELVEELELDSIPVWNLDGFFKVPGTLQETWIEYLTLQGEFKAAFVYSDFYNGAASTHQCEMLLMAIQEALDPKNQVKALVLMGGGYWNNGIHLGVCSTDVAAESWRNINAINDCVKVVMEQSKVVTFAAIRGNAAAGGFALATCCDFVFAVDSVVINPHYRAVGLYGSEYHTLTWYSRAGEHNAREFLRGMLPMSAVGAQRLGLVDRVIFNSPTLVEDIQEAVAATLSAPANEYVAGAPWTRSVCGRGVTVSNAEAVPRRKEAWFQRLPQPLSEYRRQELDFMKYNFTDPRYHACVAAFTGKGAARSTPLRFALHRRFSGWHSPFKTDPEEDVNYFAYPTPPTKQEVHKALQIPAPSSDIQLLLPPSLRTVTQTTSFAQAPPTVFSSTEVTPMNSSDEEESHRNGFSHVISRIKAALNTKVEKNRIRIRVLSTPKPPSIVKDTSVARLSLSPTKAELAPTTHQMTCYYNSIEAPQ